MLWVGLTGGLATGKSSVSQLLRKKGFSVIDADRKAKEVLEKGSDAYWDVVHFFGEQVLGPDQEINRTELAKRVFNSNEDREQLEKIVHPRIQKSVASDRQYLQDQGLQIAFYDVPLLFEKRLQSQFDAIILVYAPKEKQIERAMLRNSWSQEEVLSRLNHQEDIESKKSQSRYVIDNSGPASMLEGNLNKVLNQILADFKLTEA